MTTDAKTEETPICPTMSTELIRMEQHIHVLVPHDHMSEQRCLLILRKCAEAARTNDEERRSLTDPINAKLRGINAVYQPVTQAFQRLKEMIEQRLVTYRLQLRQQTDDEQRRLLEKEKQARLAQEAKAREAREKANSVADMLLQARALDGPEQHQHQLERDLAQAESKAEREEDKLQAMPIARVVERPAKTVEAVDGTKTTFREVKEWEFLNGLPKDTVIYRNDTRFRDIEDCHFRFDPTTMTQRVNAKHIQAGNDTIPGVRVVSTMRTQLRQAVAPSS